MTEILIFVGGYFAVLGICSLAATPYRLRLKTLMAELCEQPLTDEERFALHTFAISAYSIRSAPSVALAYIQGLLQSVDALNQEYDEHVSRAPTLHRDARMHEVLECYMASVSAVNPIFGLLAYVLRQMFRIRMKLIFKSDKAAAVDHVDFVGLAVRV